MSKLILKNTIFTVNNDSPIEISGKIKENKLHTKFRSIYRNISDLPIVLTNDEGDFFYNTNKNILGTVFSFGFGNYGSESTLLERNYSEEFGKLDTDFESLARKYRISQVEFSNGKIFAKNIAFNNSYNASIPGPGGQKAKNTHIKQRYSTEVNSGALLDQAYSVKNIRAFGKDVLSPINGLYKPYPFYTVVYTTVVSEKPTMDLFCGKFIIPMERFELTNLIYIFKYPEWLLNNSELIDSIDSATLVGPTPSSVLGGYPNFGFNPTELYTISNKAIVGNDSIINYTNYIDKYYKN